MADPQKRPEVAQLVAEYHEAVYRYAYRLTGSVHDAEDLTQSTFLAAHRNIGQLRNTGNLRAWLFTVLRNCFFKDRKRRRPALAGNLPLDVGQIEAPSAGDDIDRDQLQDALNRLPKTSRLVLVMFYFEDCSYREIADRLEMPIGTVMSRLSRAKDCLRSLLVPEQGPRRRNTRMTGNRG